jgi:hypothetical protein
MLASCAAPPPPINAAASIQPRRPNAHSRPEDVCEIYHSMFPASVIGSLESMSGDARISTRTESGDATPAQVEAIRASTIEATGGPESLWARIPETLLMRAFRSWRRQPLPHCAWRAYAREVSAPVRQGRVGPVLTSRETGSYTRVSRPFFIDGDTAIVLVRESLRDEAYVKRKLVLTYRDGNNWAMLPHTFEERMAPPR